MKFDASDLHVDVYRKTGNGMYLIKLSFPTMGLYWSGWTVRSSSRSRSGLWVQSPAHQQPNKTWKKDAEFSNDSPFLDFIEDEVMRAIDVWNSEQDTVIEDIPDEPISLDDIPDF